MPTHGRAERRGRLSAVRLSRIRGRLRWQLAAVAVISAALGITAWALDAFDGQELNTIDTRFAIRGAEPAPDDIVVVGINASTLRHPGLSRWPISRQFHADAIDALSRDGAAVIAYDIQFTEPSGDPAADNALIRAVGRAGGVVLSTTEVGPNGSTNVFGGDRVVRSLGAEAASTVLPGESDGVIRKVPYEDRGLASFAAATVAQWRGRPVDASSFEQGSAWIDFRGPPGTIESIPFWRVATGRFAPGTFRDKVVVVGTTAPSLQDLHSTSVTGDALMSGPEIQANAISSIDRGNPLSSSPDALTIALIILLAALPAIASALTSPARGMLIALAVALVYLVALQLAFGVGLILPAVYPLGTLAVATTGALAVQYLATAFERRRVHDLFARFVPERVVDQVLARTDDDLRLGGVRIEGTILFSDIRGFTSFSESQPAEQVIEILNRYLSAMSDAILDQGGTITTYIGDGIMALFGAPLPEPDHADRAVAAAREMLEEKLPSFNAWLREQGLEEFSMGIGLNTGPVMAGNVGSDRRLEYTAIGDTVNTASRLESMTKDSGHQVFIADSTREALREPDVPLVFVDEVPVRGRRATVRVWSLPQADEDGGARSASQTRLRELM